MAGEKYVVAAVENRVQVAVRNILNPHGYVFLEHCSDPVSLLRLVRSYHPDFIVVDSGMQLSNARSTLETVDDEMLCTGILLGEYGDAVAFSIVEKSKVFSFCPKPLNRDILLNTVDLAILNYRRMLELDLQLRKMTEEYESKKRIERAKIILMEQGLSEKDAYGMIRKRSMDERTTMRSIADSIIYLNRS
jgi:response regulator NasT